MSYVLFYTAWRLKTVLGYSPHLAWYPSLIRWGCSSTPKAAAKPGESYRVQSSKRRWQKAETTEKKTLNGQKRRKQKRGEEMHKFKTRYWPKLLRTYIDHMCYWPTRSITFICRVISLMEHENTCQFKQRYRPGASELGSKPWPWSLFGSSTEGKDDEEDE